MNRQTDSNDKNMTTMRALIHRFNKRILYLTLLSSVPRPHR